MKTQAKEKLQQIAFNHSPDIDFQDYMNPHQKYTAKPCAFLVIDTALPSNNPLHFRKNLVEIIWKLIMTIDENIRDEKLKYGFNREVTKISALSTEKNWSIWTSFRWRNIAIWSKQNNKTS